MKKANNKKEAPKSKAAPPAKPVAKTAATHKANTSAKAKAGAKVSPSEPIQHVVKEPVKAAAAVVKKTKAAVAPVKTVTPNTSAMATPAAAQTKAPVKKTTPVTTPVATPVEAVTTPTPPKKATPGASKAATKPVGKVSSDERLHSVENMIKTKYQAPNGTNVNGAAIAVKTAPHFSTQGDATHVIFVTKDMFGTSLADSDEEGPGDKKEAKEMDVTGLTTLYPHLNWSTIKPSLTAQGFTSGAGGIAALANTNGQPVLVVGLGKIDTNTKSVSPSTFRKSLDAAITKAKAIKAQNVQVQLPFNLKISKLDAIPTGFGNGIKGLRQQDEGEMDDNHKTSQGLRTMITANHTFDAYLKAATVKSKHNRITNLTLITPKSIKLNPQKFHTAVHRAESENFAKELGSLRANHATSIFVKEQCEALAAAHPDVVKIKILDKAALEKEGHTLILSVNAGSALPPFIVGMEYTPPGLSGAATKKIKKNDDGAQDGPIVCVGKGLLFDTGAKSLKPTTSMDSMYTDKHGACNALSLMRTLALTRPETSTKIVSVLALTDNQIAPNSTNPSDVIHTPKGSVSIDNTDAEGRLALADAITFSQKEYKPSRIITMATLTGAIANALGTNTGLFSNHKRVAREIMDTGDEFGEVMWHMPILPSNHSALEQRETDLSNISKGPMGGSTAAAFLEKFIEPNVSFVHLDIAGSSSKKDNTVTGATVATLQEVISKH